MRLTILILVAAIGQTLNAQTIDTDYSKNKKSAIKMEFFSPLFSNTTLGFESYVKDWVSWEAKIGIIGLGRDMDHENPSGFFIKAGPKFKLNPDFVTDDLRGSHLLSGRYIRPEIIFSTFKEDYRYYNYNTNRNEQTRKDFTSVAFLINYGRQFILANIITLDYHIGLGYGYISSKETSYYYSHINGDSDFPLAFSAGFTIGVLLK